MDKELTLKTDPRNARLHPPRNLEAVKRSLDELGAGRSIVVDKSGVAIGGSAVLEKAVELGLDMEFIHTKGDKLVVVVRDDLATDDPKRKALALADNQIALLAEWDESMLEEIKLELTDIEDFDFDATGFEEGGAVKERYADNTPAYTGEFQVLVIDLTEEKQGALLEELLERGFTCRALIL